MWLQAGCKPERLAHLVLCNRVAGSDLAQQAVGDGLGLFRVLVARLHELVESIHCTAQFSCLLADGCSQEHANSCMVGRCALAGDDAVRSHLPEQECEGGYQEAHQEANRCLSWTSLLRS